jgi:hypothetical protein
MCINTLSGYSRQIQLITRSRTLLEFTNSQAIAGAVGVARMGARTVLTVPWETWGTTKSRIQDHDPNMWVSVCGERCVSTTSSHVVMRDYNPYRVRRALAMFGAAGREVTLACGSLVKVVKETSVYHGGEWFCSDIETSLPYIETITRYNKCGIVCTDEHYLVLETRTEVSHVHGH